MKKWNFNMTVRSVIKFAIASIMLSFIQLGAAHAASATIETAKSQCVVGEQIDGYLGVVDGATISQNVEREIRAVNQQRKAAYADLAGRNGVTIDDAEMLTAERLINAAPSGHCVQDSSGSWTRK